MKPRKVTISLEVLSAIPAKELKGLVKDAVNEITEVVQIQVNVIKK